VLAKIDSFWPKLIFFGPNRNFGQKSKWWKNFEISLRKKKFFGEKKIFGENFENLRRKS